VPAASGWWVEGAGLGGVSESSSSSPELVSPSRTMKAGEAAAVDERMVVVMVVMVVVVWAVCVVLLWDDDDEEDDDGGGGVASGVGCCAGVWLDDGDWCFCESAEISREML
jgi:hypothetical protein